jgi:hypothetical protein
MLNLDYERLADGGYTVSELMLAEIMAAEVEADCLAGLVDEAEFRRADTQDDFGDEELPW